MSNDIAKKEKNEMTALIENLQRESEYALEVSRIDNNFERMIKSGLVINKINAIVTPKFVKTYIMPLQGSVLGFKTDKDTSGGYDISVVTKVTKEALALGLLMNGNCVNIIGKNLMVVKNGFQMKINELQVNEDLEIYDHKVLRDAVKAEWDRGQIVKAGKVGRIQAKVKLTWTVNKEEKSKVKTFSCKFNAGQDEDATNGKIERKALSWLYHEITSTTLPTQDSEEREVEDIKESDVEIISNDKPLLKPVEKNAKQILEDKRCPINIGDLQAWTKKMQLKDDEAFGMLESHPERIISQVMNYLDSIK
jgi:hypothetical protein